MRSAQLITTTAILILLTAIIALSLTSLQADQPDPTPTPAPEQTPTPAPEQTPTPTPVQERDPVIPTWPIEPIWPIDPLPPGTPINPPPPIVVPEPINPGPLPPDLPDPINPIPSNPCVRHLSLISGADSATGTWAEGCESETRSGSHAKYFRFYLFQGREVTIDLESADADAYLYLRQGKALSGTSLRQNDDHGGSTNSQIVVTLESGSYTIEATTYNAAETGSFTLSVVSREPATEPEPTPEPEPLQLPPSPSGLEVDGRSRTSITLAWNSMEGASNYRVRYGSNTRETTSNSYRVTGLRCSRSYTFSVSAQGDGETYLESWGPDTSITANTSSCPTILPHIPPPTGLEVTLATSTSISLEWNHRQSATGYQVRHREETDSQWTTSGQLGTTPSHTVTGLTASHGYEFQVRAKGARGIYSTGFGNWSSTVKGYTPYLSMTDNQGETLTGQIELVVGQEATFRIWASSLNNHIDHAMSVHAQSETVESTIPGTTENTRVIGWSDDCLNPFDATYIPSGTGYDEQHGHVTTVWSATLKACEAGQGTLQAILYKRNTNEPLTEFVPTDDDFIVMARTATTTVTVLPNPTITIQRDPHTNAEINEGDHAHFTLNATRHPRSDLTVRVRITESPDRAWISEEDNSITRDGESWTKDILIPAGLTTADFTIRTENDTLDEENGNITVAVMTDNHNSPRPRYFTGEQSSASVTVLDDDDCGAAVPEELQNYDLSNDCLTLLAAKDSLAGTATLNWSESIPINRWQGIKTTGGTPRVTQLRLVSKVLNGTIPPSLADLPLERLFLNGNQLTGPIPPELGHTSTLLTLRLNGNRLTGNIPPELGSLPRLEDLWLANNQLTGNIPAELGQLSRLKKLNLSNNQLSGEIPRQLGQLARLTNLTLNNNMLTGEIHQNLGNLTRLKGLRLAGNQLTGCIPQGLAQVRSNDFRKLELPFCSSASP